MFWFGFILGAIAGANTGLVTFALLNAATELRATRANAADVSLFASTTGE
jgi:hypothetical protein